MIWAAMLRYLLLLMAGHCIAQPWGVDHQEAPPGQAHLLRIKAGAQVGVAAAQQGGSAANLPGWSFQLDLTIGCCLAMSRSTSMRGLFAFGRCSHSRLGCHQHVLRLCTCTPLYMQVSAALNPDNEAAKAFQVESGYCWVYVFAARQACELAQNIINPICSALALEVCRTCRSRVEVQRITQR
jgi:hypothetical protein